MDDSRVPAGRVVGVRDVGRDGIDGAPRRLEPGPLTCVVEIDGFPVADMPAGARLRLGPTAIARLGGPERRGGLSEAGTGEVVPAEILDPGGIEPGDAVVLESIALPLSDVLDLHSFRPDETAKVLAEYLREAHRAGLDEVRIVHGRGRGVQREIVRRVLAETQEVTRFADASTDRGGWGATVAHLRRGEAVSST
jgi:hypothetical protein